MFSAAKMPSTTQVLSTYTAFSASAMLVKSIISEIQSITNQLIPQKLQEKIQTTLTNLLGSNKTSQLNVIVNEKNGYATNEIYTATELYLSTRITPSVNQLRVVKEEGDATITVSVDKGQKIADSFQGITFMWESVCTESQTTVIDYETLSTEAEKTVHRSYVLSFDKKHKDTALNAYLPFILDKAKAIKNENRTIKLHSLGGSSWASINLNHPSTFDTIAMEPELKQQLIDDLDRFLKRKEYYKRVGKPWKRGYLLYGPPGTGKSSLIAAMANHLKFSTYDLELTSLNCDSELKRLLTSTENRSILVIEDIDCSAQSLDRQSEKNTSSESQLTLSGLLNFIDGLWSSCSDERIIVFTTNYKERLDPALLRPGRMDMHIHMSYCTPNGFKILAYNYLNIKEHALFNDIEALIQEVEVTPAQIAEELMKSDDVDFVLRGLVGFLLKKKEAKCEENNVNVCDEKEMENKEMEDEGKEEVNYNCEENNKVVKEE